jgi:hypothetical protein
MGNTAARTITLPPAADCKGIWFCFIKNSADAEIITLDGNGSETIDGNATITTMDADYDTITILCDGTEWFIVAQKIA